MVTAAGAGDGEREGEAGPGDAAQDGRREHRPRRLGPQGRCRRQEVHGSVAIFGVLFVGG